MGRLGEGGGGEDERCEGVGGGHCEGRCSRDRGKAEGEEVRVCRLQGRPEL